MPRRQAKVSLDTPTGSRHELGQSPPGRPGSMAKVACHAKLLIPIEGAHQNEMIAPAVTE